jgi:predicted O-methyltransferase YrrM
MDQHTAPLCRPKTDDRALWDVISGMLECPCLLVAHDLGLFPLLAERPRSMAEVAVALKIAPRPAETLLAMCAAIGVVSRGDDGRHALTPPAEDYLLDDSPTSFGGYLNLLKASAAVYSYEGVKRAVLTDAPQAYGGEDWVKSHEGRAALARDFTYAMHSAAVAPALAWPDAVDLSDHRLMLDIGGGSGAHSMGAAMRWRQLRALIVDIPSVCPVAGEIVAKYGLSDRVSALAADMWNDPLPPADLHFYSMIYHDWPPEKCRALTRKSFDSLGPGGRLIVHELLFHDDRPGPTAVAGYSVAMLLWTEGKQYSGSELAAMLVEAGFTDVEVKPTFGYWGIVTGRKPWAAA